MKTKTWRDYYKMPLKVDKWPDGYIGNYVFTNNDGMALTFDYGVKGNTIEDIVTLINGEKEGNVENITNEGPQFFVDGKKFFCVRGWGALHSKNVHGLSIPQAIVIQDQFINYILEKLTQNEN